MADFIAKGNKPINGYGGADHGIVELWKNTDIVNAFAGQTITIQDFDSDKYDALVIVTETQDTEKQGADWIEFDKEVVNSTNLSLRKVGISSSSSYFRVYDARRPVSFSLVENTLTITFGDCAFYLMATYGTNPTATTVNTLMIPVRVLGLIHND